MCKTCSDYKHVCLGYSDSTAHLRSQSDSASRTHTVPPLAGAHDSTSQRNTRAVESCSPEPPPAPIPKIKPDKSPKVPKWSEIKDASSRDTSARTNKETESQAAGDSPEGSKSELSPTRLARQPCWRFISQMLTLACSPQVALQ